MMVDFLTIALLLGALGALSAVGFVALVNRYPKGGPEFVSVWAAIREGSIAYLKRQYRTIFTISIFIFI
ncbi:MAG: hypothetical protein QXZ71_03545, partial [Candidatus Caldarchaeum sp.]